MKTLVLAFMICSFSLTTFGQSASEYYFVSLKTEYGSCLIRLYNETPVHRDNFLKLAKSGYFDQTTFNRVIKGFVIQGGDSDSAYLDLKKLKKEQQWIKAEFHDSLFHKKAVIAMGRDDNPDKQSFSTQFYLVEGKKWTDTELDNIEKKGGYQIPPAQRSVYKTIGGIPYLDKNYTVFGEIVEGMELIDKISAIATVKDGVPVKPVVMKVTLTGKLNEQLKSLLGL